MYIYHNPCFTRRVLGKQIGLGRDIFRIFHTFLVPREILLAQFGVFVLPLGSFVHQCRLLAAIGRLIRVRFRLFLAFRLDRYYALKVRGTSVQGPDADVATTTVYDQRLDVNELGVAAIRVLGVSARVRSRYEGADIGIAS